MPIGNWYWTATRIIPETINEIPFFTFVYADLHADLMALPFALVGLGLAAHAALNRAKLKWYDLGIAALVLGALRAINTWDYPTYLALIGCAMVIGYFLDARANDPGEFHWGEWIQRYLLFIVLAFVQVAVIIIPTNAAGTRITFDMVIYVVVLLFALAFGLIKFKGHLDPRAHWLGFGLANDCADCALRRLLLALHRQLWHRVHQRGTLEGCEDAADRLFSRARDIFVPGGNCT